MKNDLGTVPLSQLYRGGTVGHCTREQENCSNNNEATCLKRLAGIVLQRANQKNIIEAYGKNTVPQINNDGTELLNELFEERAAIIEFDGGFSREEAEYLAGIEMKLIAGKNERNKN